jgi:hypothetical protein
MKREEFGLKPPHNSYVDLIEHMSDGVVVDVITRDRVAEETNEPGESAAIGRENNRLSSQSNRGERG